MTQVERINKGILPPVWYLQMDNTTSSNKNITVMCWLADLVARGVFQTINMDFLPVGHTHNHVDAFIGTVSKKLKRRTITSLEQYQRLIAHSVFRSRRPRVMVHISL